MAPGKRRLLLSLHIQDKSSSCGVSSSKKCKFPSKHVSVKKLLCCVKLITSLVSIPVTTLPHERFGNESRNKCCSLEVQHGSGTVIGVSSQSQHAREQKQRKKERKKHLQKCVPQLFLSHLQLTCQCKTANLTHARMQMLQNILQHQIPLGPQSDFNFLAKQKKKIRQNKIDVEKIPQSSLQPLFYSVHW